MAILLFSFLNVFNNSRLVGFVDTGFVKFYINFVLNKQSYIYKHISELNLCGIFLW